MRRFREVISERMFDEELKNVATLEISRNLKKLARVISISTI
jgi:hypothetical protein